MITVKNRANGLVEDVLGNGSGAVCVEPTERYLDLGQIVNSTSVPAGATVFNMSWTDGLQWVRNIKFLVQSDRTTDIIMMCRDSSPVGGMVGATCAGSVPASGSEGWRPVSAVDGAALCGHGAMFGLKNVSGDTATYLKLRVQLMG